MRAIIYTRVSSDPNERSRSVREQEAECRAVCDRNRWKVVAVLSDNDRSASRYAVKSRPAYKQLIELVNEDGCDVLVTWEASRAQRDLRAYADLRDLCERRGVLLSYSGRTYDMSDADDRFGTGLDALLAERESEQTRKRVLRAVRANADKGRPHGKLLYGYRREYDPTTRELIGQVPDPDTALVVQEAARRVLAGETPYTVAQDFDRRGIPTPRAGKGWDLTQIKRLCVNPGYAGLRVHQGRVVGDAAWPSLVDKATHLALVAKLSDPSRRTQRDSAVRHLLSGIAICGVCGGRLRVQKNRGFLAYLCVTGFHVSRREDHVNALVEAVTVGRLQKPDVLALLNDDDDDETVIAALAEAREKRARLEGFYDAAAAGDLTPAALARVEARLLPEIEGAERRAQRATVPAVVAETAGPDAAARWPALTLPQRREVIGTLMTVRILPTNRGARTFRPEDVEILWKGAGE